MRYPLCVVKSGKYSGDRGDVQPGSEGAPLGAHVGYRQVRLDARFQHDTAQDDAL